MARSFLGGMFVREDIACFSARRAGVSSAIAAKHNQFFAPSVFGITVETIDNLGCRDNEGLRVVGDKNLSEYF